jgi:hypothetical protein
MTKRQIVLFLAFAGLVIAPAMILMLVMGFEPKENHPNAPAGREVTLTPVWTFCSADRICYNVHEFTDRERGEHCYVIMKTANYRSGVALSCEKMGD